MKRVQLDSTGTSASLWVRLASSMGTMGFINRYDCITMGTAAYSTNGYECNAMGTAASTNGYERNVMGTTASTNGYGCNVMCTAASTDGRAKDCRESCWYNKPLDDNDRSAGSSNDGEDKWQDREWLVTESLRPCLTSLFPLYSNDSFTCYLLAKPTILLAISFHRNSYFSWLSLYRND